MKDDDEDEQQDVSRDGSLRPGQHGVAPLELRQVRAVSPFLVASLNSPEKVSLQPGVLPCFLRAECTYNVDPTSLLSEAEKLAGGASQAGRTGIPLLNLVAFGMSLRANLARRTASLGAVQFAMVKETADAVDPRQTKLLGNRTSNNLSHQDVSTLNAIVGLDHQVAYDHNLRSANRPVPHPAAHLSGK